ncbi:hypothetical protein [Nocardia brasiliensis]|uniref:hypothetical protein n=1 Tax=Nocardia brasiliensis TaxID=37326 RepID=UPI003D8B6E96
MVAAALVAGAALSGCSSDKSGDNASPSATSAVPVHPVTSGEPVPCVDDQGHGPDNAPPCDTSTRGQKIALDVPTKIQVPADAVLVLYAPEQWGGARSGLTCTALDSGNAPVTLLPPTEGAATLSFDGQPWSATATVSAPAGEATISCADGGGRLPKDQGPLFIRAVTTGLQFR